MARLSAIFVSAVLAVVPALAWAGDFQIPLDQARSITLAEPAAGVVVGNPEIAAVSIQNDHLVFVTGRSYGATSLTIVGRKGQPLFEGRLTVVPDETNVVMLTAGRTVQRFDCTPLCRRRPDLSDDDKSYQSAITKSSGRGGGAAPKE